MSAEFGNRILLFIPVYNCEKQITRVLAQLSTGDMYKFFSEVIIVNNRSTDNGEEAVINYLIEHKLPLKISLLRNDENYNLGGSHKVAFQYAAKNNFDYLVVLHGDDQADIADFKELFTSGDYKNYDCCLGTRFMKDAQLKGYSWHRIAGNYVFNLLFSIAAGKIIKDLGSGLNMYKLEKFRNLYFMKYPDSLYFNPLMLLASCYYGHKILFYPISWREDDQVSNAKLFSYAMSLFKMLAGYVLNKKKYISREHRKNIIEKYSAQVIYVNKNMEE